MPGVMNLAAEGGTRRTTWDHDKVWLVVAMVAGIVGILAAPARRNVVARTPGRPRCERSRRHPRGCEAFLSASSAPSDHCHPLAILIFFTATQVVRPDGTVASPSARRPLRVICFCSAPLLGLTGFIGMSSRTRQRAHGGAASQAAPWQRPAGGLPDRAVTGMLCVGLGSSVRPHRAHLPEHGDGRADRFRLRRLVLALFMRVGGGISRSGRRGRGPRGKVEAGIPETTRVTRPPLRTTSATTWATAPAWRPTSSSL